jgi:L-aminopeptidase/D-esterase-like protein
MRFLEEQGIGFDTGLARVPIVPAAVIYDLGVGSPRARPDSQMGYLACQNASSGPVEEGQVGAGAGASVGKLLGRALSSPGGIGTASAKLPNGITVGVLAVVNAFGDIVDPESGQILAGALKPDRSGWLDTARALIEAASPVYFPPAESTTLVAVATDAALTKAQAKRVAAMSHDGMARAIRPVHTMVDGDLVFVLSTRDLRADVTTIGTLAAELTARAIARVGRTAIEARKLTSPRERSS